MRDYYAARAPEYDDWYLRRGRYSRGPARDLAWHAELDQATAWLDRVPFSGDIVELAAGTGWWSPLLAQKGELSMYDANPGPLEIARERLVAHHLRAHLHVRDAWAEPDREVDGVFCGFWLSHVPEARLADFLGLASRWLRPGGGWRSSIRCPTRSRVPSITIRSPPTAPRSDVSRMAASSGSSRCTGPRTRWRQPWPRLGSRTSGSRRRAGSS